jgi:hypothetical protein
VVEKKKRDEGEGEEKENKKRRENSKKTEKGTLNVQEVGTLPIETSTYSLTHSMALQNCSSQAK